jgi:Leucine-rich repeat (LRR) protein
MSIKMPIIIHYQNNNNNIYNFNSFKEIKNYDKVDYIYCGFNQLTSLPELPNSLQYLYCYNNQLIELPPLPNSIQSLNCLNNQLTSLPELPDSLQTLSCYNNKFIEKIKHKYLIKIINL